MKGLRRSIGIVGALGSVMLLLAGCAQTTLVAGGPPGVASPDVGSSPPVLTQTLSQQRLAAITELVRAVRAGPGAPAGDGLRRPFPVRTPALASVDALMPVIANTMRAVPLAYGPVDPSWQHVATVQFAAGSAAPGRLEQQMLAAFARFHRLRGGPLQVVGHAEETEAEGDLSPRRATAVVEALAARGIPRTLLAIADIDPAPAAVDTTPSGEEQAGERRAELYWREGGKVMPNPVPAAGALVLAAGAAPPPDALAVAAPASHPERLPAQPAFPDAQQLASACDACRVHVATIYFDHGSAQVRADDVPIVRAIAHLQRELGGEVRIIGHASARGGSAVRAGDGERLERANRRISRQRATTLAAALTDLGVAGEHVDATGLEAAEPASSEPDAIGEAKNHRAEIYIDLPGPVRLAEAAGLHSR